MKTQDWLTKHDLSLTFDNAGRLWKFRPSDAMHGPQPVDAAIIENTIMITVTAPGITSGDVDLHVNDDVLEIRGKTDRTMHLACDVALPMAFGLDQLETAYADETLAIRVLPPGKVRKPTYETVQVAC